MQIWRYAAWEPLNFIIISKFTVIIVINIDFYPLYFQVLQDKKLKGQLTVREELYGKSAKAAVKAEKVTFRLRLIITYEKY